MHQLPYAKAASQEEKVEQLRKEAEEAVAAKDNVKAKRANDEIKAVKSSKFFLDVLADRRQQLLCRQ